MKIFKRVILVIFIIIFVILAYLLYNGYTYYKRAMAEKSIEDRVAELYSMEHFTRYEDLPDYYTDAVVSVEDHRFYQHGGVDILAIVRALRNNARAGEMREGGSSITQQVAKNLCFTQEKSVYRKIAELFAVRQLEKNYSKEEIFELYVNNMYFGNGYYNIYDASHGYFEKEPIDLTLYEATLLAGVPNAPSVYAPTKNLKLAEERQAQVLDAMVEYGNLSDKEAKAIKDMQETRS